MGLYGPKRPTILPVSPAIIFTPLFQKKHKRVSIRNDFESRDYVGLIIEEKATRELLSDGQEN